MTKKYNCCDEDKNKTTKEMTWQAQRNNDSKNKTRTEKTDKENGK